ncbi:MAG: hypothetical protein H7Y38_08375 [Armatimonadetes bacterium]|nr:hypothetical protein [Armatimonadota bacterium]
MKRTFFPRLLAAFVSLAATFALGATAQTADAPTLAVVATITHPPINELSGMVKSRRYPNTYWVHNDSGDAARLFAVRSDGTVIVPPFVQRDYFADVAVEGKTEYPGIGVSLATNYDWEDIAIDGDTLYIADTGNNGNGRRDLGVYVLAEPNPEAVVAARVLKWLPVAYPDQSAYPPEDWHFDCEAIFVVRGKLHFLTKWREGSNINAPGVGASLYRLDTQYTDRVNVLKLVETKADLGGWVTGASVSPDGKTLAVLCQAPTQSVWLYDISGGGEKLLSRPARRMVFTGGKQCESVCFDGNDTLLVGNEQRDLFRLPVAGLKPAPARESR